ncbi:MAG: hypothetical protein IKK34_08090 [Clostridia bacterium]|nr:hypothetical protein [Clostridia bacterium]
MTAKLKNITISVEDAKQLFSLYSTCESADRHFYSCQSASFRQFVSSTYKAANVSGAFARLKEKIESKEV